MKHSRTDSRSQRRIEVTVRGVVQGIGMRPFVYQAARSRGLAGWVQNEADTVRIEIAGQSAAVAAFLEALEHDAPRQARIDSIDVAELPAHDAQRPPADPAFEIRASRGGGAPAPVIPADLATCADCLAEINDPAQRRYRYAFTNCTACGPRWSIIRQLPYDRPRTSMSGFAMCAACQAEYDEPADRRFHAQPIACPRCGPALELLDPQGKSLAAGPSALEAAQLAIRAGQIVALKGLGGFQLLADATSAEAVARLRSRKARPHRPLAVMFPALADVRRYCELSAAEARALQSHEAPILLLRRLAVSGRQPAQDKETDRDAETRRRGDAGTSKLSVSPCLRVSVSPCLLPHPSPLAP
ncbi:MAG: acylphosphatase, partial [Thermoguttaceae bacterium]